MASTKKTKKSKGVTLSFQEFSARVDGDTTPSGNVVYAPGKKPASGGGMSMSSWADEVEEDDFITTKERIVLPTAPRASRGPAYEDAQIPKVPPFQANIGNLHYDIEEEDIYKFFRDLDILELKLPRDHVTGRIKGFGFVVFSTRQDLIDALVMNEQMLRGRPIRVALLSGDQRVGGGGERREYRERPPAEDEGVDNWRSMAGAVVDKSSGSFNQRSEYPSRGGDRGGDFRGGNFNRRSNFPIGGDDQDQEEQAEPWRRSQQGPPPSRDNYSMRGGNDDSRDFHNHHRGGGGGGRDDRRGNDNYEPRQRSNSPDFVRGPTSTRPPPPIRQQQQYPPQQHHPRAERERVEPPPSQSSSDDGVPKTRKKLVLAPRTAPTAATPTESAERSSSIFGEAKPVDTLKRELEIEEKLKLVQVKSASGSEAGEESGDGGGGGGIKRGVVRLRSRDGSEREIPSQSAPKWRSSRGDGILGGGVITGDMVRSNNTSRRTHSQSSGEAGIGEKDPHSDPEDERDFKQQQMQREQREQRGAAAQRGPPPSRQHDNYYPRGGDRGGDPRGGGMDRHNNRGGPRGNNSSHYSSHHAQESKRIIDQDGFETYQRPTGGHPSSSSQQTTPPSLISPSAAGPPPEKLVQNKFAALEGSDDD
ncbi:eukaryotic translation initiation factor 4B isoform X2 [Folsomia candida]|uniref:eukaryotic translation initiation factor 4B isoform X2 n=1 Tax=Folsomia candida TaxID=158441 RepID=UPI000B904548|nr:eukaryotic translation initiation factor 4B isoform X2 [Folsomia candida]